eukprot:m.1082433 g.1082433  ORF g.1082433 m.1082433 type:complete len:1886 (-) comp24266_c0_seq4:397-6054(-)
MPAERANKRRTTSRTSWQTPFVDVFKHLELHVPSATTGSGKKCSKIGDVTRYTDKVLNKEVFRIVGPVPESTCLSIPKASSQSLGLVGKQLYVVFRVPRDKFFVMHFDIGTASGIAVRVSISNMYKEFKATATWLQFPILELTTKWTFLHLDLGTIVSLYTTREFQYIKWMQFCANVYVRGAYTSDLIFKDPETTPRAMRLMVPAGTSWASRYDMITFPTSNPLAVTKPSSQPRAAAAQAAPLLATPLLDEAPPWHVDGPPHTHSVTRHFVPARVSRRPATLSTADGSGVSSRHVEDWGSASGLPAVGLDQVEVHSLTDLARTNAETVAVRGAASAASHASTAPATTDKASMTRIDNIARPPENTDTPHSADNDTLRVDLQHQQECAQHVAAQAERAPLHSVPVVHLGAVVGYTPTVSGSPAWGGADNEFIVYSCDSIVVAMGRVTRKQKLLVGHTGGVRAITLGGHGRNMLVSACHTPRRPQLRVWDLETGRCVGVATTRGTHARYATHLSLSMDGTVLVVVAQDAKGKQMISVLDSSAVFETGNMPLITETRSDVSIECFQIAPIAGDVNRMVSCGRDNIRVWRVRHGVLRSSPINLARFHDDTVVFTALAFRETTGVSSTTNRRQTPGVPMHALPRVRVWVASSAGQVIDIDVEAMRVLETHTLVADAITCVRCCDAFAVTGGVDGRVRVWAPDFSETFVVTEHTAAVSDVGVCASDGLVLVGTRTGIIGVLDIASQEHTTVMRSHTADITAVVMHKALPQFVSLSHDGTIRVWCLETHAQLFEFNAPEEIPLCGDHHPSKNMLCCGFDSGHVRIFDVDSAEIVAVQNQHTAVVSTVLFAPPTGDRLFSIAEDGVLVMYDAEHEYAPSRILHVAAPGPVSMSLNSSGTRLAYTGPVEHVLSIVDGTTLDEITAIDVLSSRTAAARTSGNTRIGAQLIHVAFAKHTDNVLYTTSTDGTLTLINSDDQSVVDTHRSIRKSPGDARPTVQALATHPWGWYLAAATSDRALQMWDSGFNPDVECQTFQGHGVSIDALAFSKGGTILVGAGGVALLLWAVERAVQVPCRPPRHPADSGSALPAAVGSNRDGGDRGDAPVGTHVRSDARRVPAADEHAPVPLPPPRPTAPTLQHDTGRGGVNLFPAAGRDAVAAPVVSVTDSVTADIADATDPIQSEHKSTGSQHVSFTSKPPAVHSHYCNPDATSSSQLATERFTVSPEQEGIRLEATVGYNGSGRNNATWHAATGLFAYTIGPRVVLDDLDTRRQHHLCQHTETVSTLAVTSCGRILASACGPSIFTENLAQICLWNVGPDKTASGRRHECMQSLLYHLGDIGCLAFSADDRFLASVGNYTDGAVAVWEVQTGTMVAAAQADAPINRIQWDPCSPREFATVGQQGILQFWLVDESQAAPVLNVHTAATPETFAPQMDAHPVLAKHYTAMGYAAADAMLYVGDSDGILTAWDTQHNTCVASWPVLPGEVCAVAVRGHRVVTAGGALLKAWTLQGGTGSEALVFDGQMDMDGSVTAMCVDSVAAMGIVATDSGSIWYINWPENSSIRIVSSHSQDITDVAISNDDAYIATSANDGTVRVFTRDTNEQIMQFQLATANSRCLCVALSADTSRCVAGYDDGAVRTFDLDKIALETKFEPHGGNGAVTRVMYSHDGRAIISASATGVIVVSSATSGGSLRVLQDHRGSSITCFDIVAIRSADVDPPTARADESAPTTSMWLAGSADRRVTVWRADWSRDTCVLVDWLTYAAPPPPAVAPNADGVFQAPPTLARFTPCAPDIVVVATYSREPELIFHSVSQRVALKRLPMTAWALSLDVSPMGRLIAVGTDSRLVRIIDYDQGSFQDFIGHSDNTTMIKFAKQQPYMITVSQTCITRWTVEM